MAILDIASRKVLAWRLSRDERGFLHRGPAGGARQVRAAGVFQHRPGSQFTSEDWTTPLKEAGVANSMDGTGRWIDNIFQV
jgi:transposase InsO family protein